MSFEIDKFEIKWLFQVKRYFLYSFYHFRDKNIVHIFSFWLYFKQEHFRLSLILRHLTNKMSFFGYIKKSVSNNSFLQCKFSLTRLLFSCRYFYSNIILNNFKILCFYPFLLQADLLIWKCCYLKTFVIL